MEQFKKGTILAIPIVVGYFTASVAFGLVSKNTGIPLNFTVLFSVLVFAGASQFMAVNLISTGAMAWEIILATFLLNLRHILMSSSLTIKVDNIKKRHIPFIAFVITDEVFSVSSTREGKLKPAFVMALGFISYSSWILGTVVGYIAGSVIPTTLGAAMGIALYAMFVAIVVPEIKKYKPVIFLFFAAGGLNLLLTYIKIFSGGWSLIIATIIISTCGALFLNEKNPEKEVQDVKCNI
jgi:4-azaleucine resistance transporter AzlC